MRLPALFTILLLSAGFCLAQPSGENLLQIVPQGYRIGWHIKKGNMILTEMVPQAQTVDDWSEMLTTQVFLQLKGATPERIQALTGKGWLASCKDGEAAPITKGEENGYPFAIWLQACPLHPKTGKPEYTWFKAIQGNDSFYVVQKAFRFQPSKEEVTHWMQYFRSVVVCDSRLSDRQCSTSGHSHP